MGIVYLKGKSCSQYVQQVLLQFYHRRPDVYGLLEEDCQVNYQAYANSVSAFSEGRTKVLDFGCGSWRSPLELSRHGFEVTGIDVFSDEKYQEFCDVLKDRPRVRLSTYAGTGPLPFDAQSFEIISSYNVFEHILDVPGVLSELRRLLMPKGRIMIHCPNWSAPNNPVRAFIKMMNGTQRYFHFDRLGDVLTGFFRSLKYPLQIRCSGGCKFIYIYPRMKEGVIHFQQSDDDAVHLCVPTSFRRWFSENGFQMICYNKGAGANKVSKYFNGIFPMYATRNLLVAELKEHKLCTLATVARGERETHDR